MSGFSEDRAPCDAPESGMTKAEFLRWVQGREGKFELKGGQVVMQAGGSRNHAKIIGRFVSALAQRLDPESWSVIPTELAVEIGPDIRYPDILVEPENAAGRRFRHPSQWF